MENEGYLQALEAKKKRCIKLKENCEEIFLNNKKIVLEIGCGHGHYLTKYANQYREKCCVGIDLQTKRIDKANKKKDTEGLKNLFFHKAEASEFLSVLPDEIVLKEIIILFPDPWPKKRHQKNRLIQSEFLDLLAENAEKGANLYFRTDHQGYFEYALRIFSDNKFWTLTAGERWVFEYETVFQQKMDSYQSFIATRI